MKLLAGILAALGLLAAVFVFLTTTFMDNRVSKAFQGQLRRLPYALVRLAARRLPTEAREDHAQEWTAELSVILKEAKGLPITQLCSGIRYALGLLRTAPTIGRHLPPLTLATGAASSTSPLVRAGTAAVVTTIFLAEVAAELFRASTGGYLEIVVNVDLGSGDVDVSSIPTTVDDLVATVSGFVASVLAVAASGLAVVGLIVVGFVVFILTKRMKK